MLSDMLKMIIDAMKNNPESVLGKLFSIIDQQLTDYNTTLDTAEQWIDIDKAQGVVLDEIGADVNQYRGQATDEIYRVMIRGKKARSSADGTINSMIQSLSQTLNCDPSQMEILSSIEAGEGEPAAIVIKKAPLDALNRVGMSVNQFLQFVEQVVSGEGSISHVDLEGTFSFASGAEVETSDLGFADISGATGGTLGGVFTPADDYKLPI